MVAEIIPLPRIEEPQILARSVIIYGELPDGLRLTEDIICQKTGVSRSPIREALRMLERDGLLVREPRKGVRVSKLTIDDLDELYACRVALEVTATRLAAKDASDDEIEAIRRAHEDCERKFKANDVLGHFRANVEMSQRIFEAAHNRPLRRLLDSIHKHALRYRFVAYKTSRAARQNSVQCNAELVAALVQRDGDKAAAKMRQSIETAHTFIRACLQERASRGEHAATRKRRSRR
jgi:DNA-binding GntR family transcriptional regulator